MLSANHRSKPSKASRALAGLTFIALIALAAGMALFSRDGAAIAKAQNDQDRKFVATAPMRFENPPEIPLVITEARLSVGEAQARMATGVDQDGKIVQLTFPGENARDVEGVAATLSARLGDQRQLSEKARDVEIVAATLNQGNRRVTELAVEVSNQPYFGTETFVITLKPLTEAAALAGEAGAINPQGTFTFQTTLLFSETRNGMELISHLSDFRLRIIGVKFEGEEHNLWAESAQASWRQSKTTFIKMAPMRRAKGLNEKQSNQNATEKQSDQNATDPIHQMSSSMRPTILYREKAQYTQEARDNEVEGLVALSVVFGVDAQIRDIEVVRGLPMV